MNSIEQAINLKVNVTTLLDQSHTGYIYAYSPVHELLTLRTTNRSNNKLNRAESYKFINTAFIKTIQVLAPLPKRNNYVSNNGTNANASNNSLASSPPPGKLSINELETCLNRSVANYKEMIHKSSTFKASQNGKKLFEKLYLRFPDVKFENDSIIIQDQVKLSKPYLNKPTCITKLTENASILENVQQTVREFWQQLDSSKGG